MFTSYYRNNRAKHKIIKDIFENIFLIPISSESKIRTLDGNRSSLRSVVDYGLQSITALFSLMGFYLYRNALD